MIEEQIKKYFQTHVKLLTTQCIILEAEYLGSSLAGATQIVKQFYVHKCGHEGKAVSGAQCIKQMTKDSRYIVATQDRDLQESLRKVPGRCLMYLHKAAPVLEVPSDASKKWVHKKANNLLPQDAEKKIVSMKLKERLTIKDKDQGRCKSKVSKIPNPLSCKKSKKQNVKKEMQQSKKISNDSSNHKISDTRTTGMKPKRKRIKFPAHVKEILQNKPL